VINKMIRLEKEEEIFKLTLDNGENRWTTELVIEIDRVLDEIEACDGPAALVTSASDEKFFSNGLDLEWISKAPSHERADFSKRFMNLMGRLILLPIPSICAINGHAFGAGFMFALAHDLRFMRNDRGYVCANEVEIGMLIPDPEIALFRHKLSAHVFFETVQLARRWTGPAAVTAGIAFESFDKDQLLSEATKKAKSLAHLGTKRKVFQKTKEKLFGESTPINSSDGAAYLLSQV